MYSSFPLIGVSETPEPPLSVCFGSIEDTRYHCQQCFQWYNTIHRHSGITLMTPAAVGYSTAAALIQRRAITLDAAFAANPIRFQGRAPKPLRLPTAVWINPPKKDSTAIKITAG